MRIRRTGPVVLAFTGLLSFLVLDSAQALNGNARIISCASCTTPLQFRDAALSDNNVNVMSDTSYTVVSSATNMTAFVQVTGYWMVNPWDYTQAWWTASGAAMLDVDGAPLSTDVPTAQTQMAVIDVGLFGFGRDNNPKVYTVAMPSNYAASFINSTDEETSPGIGFALGQKGINPATLSVGTKITVTFSDGSKAVFVKVSAIASLQWVWDGKNAWDSQGRKLTSRTGVVAWNPNSGGGGSGSVAIPLNVVEDAAAMWFIYQQQQCTTSTTVRINGEVVSTYSGYTPC